MGHPEALVEDIILDPFTPARDASQQGDGPSPLPGRTIDPIEADSWPVNLKAALNEAERSWLQQALERAGQRQNMAAELLGLNYNQMRALVRKHGLQTRASRQTERVETSHS